MPGNHADRVARYVQAAEALEVLQGRVREKTGEVGNLLFDRWTADDLHELACLARAERIGQNRVAAGKPRDSHNPGQIYCEESFGEDEATCTLEPGGSVSASPHEYDSCYVYTCLIRLRSVVIALESHLYPLESSCGPTLSRQ